MRPQLPQGTKSGNCLVVGWQFDNTGSPTVTVTDDQSNTYVNIIDATDSVNSQRLGFSLATNVVANTRQVNVSTTSGGAISGHQQSFVAEFFNCSTAAPATAADGGQALGNHSEGTSATIGGAAGMTAITPTQTGDLFVHMAVQVNRDQTFTFNTGAGSQANITWKQLRIDSRDGLAVQFGVYASTTGFKPQFVQGSSAHYASVAIAIKAASAGSADSTAMRIVGSQHESLWAAANGGPGYTTPITMAFPTGTASSAGNLLIASVATGDPSVTGKAVTAISDSVNGSWSKCGAGLTAGPHHTDIWYFQNAATSGAMTVTVTSSATTIDTTVVLYEVTGAATSGACDTSSSTSGLENAGNGGFKTTLNAAAITPTTTSGLLFSEMQFEFNTVDTVTAPSGALIDSQYYLGEQLDGPENFDQNGGWAHYINTSTASKTFTFHFLPSGSGGQGNWIAYSAAFKAAAGGATCTGGLLLRGAGGC